MHPKGAISWGLSSQTPEPVEGHHHSKHHKSQTSTVWFPSNLCCWNLDVNRPQRCMFFVDFKQQHKSVKKLELIKGHGDVFSLCCQLSCSPLLSVCDVLLRALIQQGESPHAPALSPWRCCYSSRLKTKRMKSSLRMVTTQIPFTNF